MPQFYAEILRSPAYRENSWKRRADNDPTNTTIIYITDSGVTATSDGDILSVSGTTSTNGVFTTSLSINTSTFPFIVVRAKGTGTIDILVTYTSGTDTFTFSLASVYVTKNFTLTAGKTVSQIKFLNQSVVGANSIDYVYVCGKAPIQLSQKDLFSGTVTRTGLGADHAEFRFNNWRGKFTPSGSSTSAFSFGDHLHVYLGQGATLFHVYGGYAELAQPALPPDEIVVNSRGFGLGLLRSKVLQIYNSSTPQVIIDDVMDTFVNPLNKNGLGIASNYQITRSFVQNLGSSIPLYVTNMNHAYNVFRELGDLTVAQGTPAVFFVDPAENLHLVPLLVQGGGGSSWTTDPFPALYGGSVAYGTNLVSVNLTRDTKSLANRVHYYSIAQIPGIVDNLTEYATDGALTGVWNIGGYGGGATNSSPKAETTAALHTVASPVAIGSHANQLDMTNNGSGGLTDVAGNMNTNFASPLDLTVLGSQWSPPLLEAYFRIHVTGQPVGDPSGTGYYSIIFFKDNANYFEYQLTSQLASSPFYDAILNIGGHATQDFWYHFLVPIGPNAGNLVLSAPAPNIIPQPVSGAVPWKATTIGGPNWNSITGIGFFGTYTGSSGINQAHVQMFLDGFRILGGRYRLAYDNRASPPRYPDMSEQFFYDPISKDETAIKNFAKAELFRLRNPIIRGTITTTLLADIVPEQQVLFTIPSANLSSTYLRCTSITHRFSPNGYITELGVSDDFTNSQPLDQWKLANALLQMGENAIFSRELYDLKTAILDPTFTPITDAYT